MKISKLSYISKNFEKKRLPVSKKVVNLHPDTNQLKLTTMENTIKMQNTFTVKIYNPMVSAWMVAASLGFVPEQYMAEKIANQFCEYTFSMYDTIRVCNGNKVLSEYNYE